MRRWRHRCTRAPSGPTASSGCCRDAEPARRPGAGLMARYEIIELEGMRFLRVTLDHETVRTERRAVTYMSGDLELRAPLPGMGEAIRCAVGNQSLIRPRFTGTGELNLKASLGGYHIFDLE